MRRLAWPGSFLSGRSFPPAQCEPDATNECAKQHARRVTYSPPVSAVSRRIGMAPAPARRGRVARATSMATPRRVWVRGRPPVPSRPSSGPAGRGGFAERSARCRPAPRDLGGRFGLPWDRRRVAMGQPDPKTPLSHESKCKTTRAGRRHGFPGPRNCRGTGLRWGAADGSPPLPVPAPTTIQTQIKSQIRSVQHGVSLPIPPALGRLCNAGPALARKLPRIPSFPRSNLNERPLSRMIRASPVPEICANHAGRNSCETSSRRPVSGAVEFVSDE